MAQNCIISDHSLVEVFLPENDENVRIGNFYTKNNKAFIEFKYSSWNDYRLNTISLILIGNGSKIIYSLVNCRLHKSVGNITTFEADEFYRGYIDDIDKDLHNTIIIQSEGILPFVFTSLHNTTYKDTAFETISSIEKEIIWDFEDFKLNFRNYLTLSQEQGKVLSQQNASAYFTFPSKMSRKQLEPYKMSLFYLIWLCNKTNVSLLSVEYVNTLGEAKESLMQYFKLERGNELNKSDIFLTINDFKDFHFANWIKDKEDLNIISQLLKEGTETQVNTLKLRYLVTCCEYLLGKLYGRVLTLEKIFATEANMEKNICYQKKLSSMKRAEDFLKQGRSLIKICYLYDQLKAVNIFENNPGTNPYQFFVKVIETRNNHTHITKNSPEIFNYEEVSQVNQIMFALVVGLMFQWIGLESNSIRKYSKHFVYNSFLNVKKDKNIYTLKGK